MPRVIIAFQYNKNGIIKIDHKISLLPWTLLFFCQLKFTTIACLFKATRDMKTTLSFSKVGISVPNQLNM